VAQALLSDETTEDLAMESVIVTEYPITYYILCIWHLKENIKKCFIENLVDHLIIFIPLFKNIAHEFTTILFILGIESILFVKSQNVCLKCIIENSNTSFYKLEKVLIDSAKNTIKQKQYEDLTRGVNLINHEFVKIVKTYLASVCEKEIISQQVENSEDKDLDKENTLPNVIFRNPRKVINKVQSKLSSHYNNQQSQHSTNELLLDSKKKRAQNHCSYCKEVDHNIAICFKKAKN
ncbi:1715_t:CDS:2, partial [Dentiscutata erythropus]